MSWYTPLTVPSTGHAQWEPPSHDSGIQGSSVGGEEGGAGGLPEPVGMGATHGKRRQYASGQTQAYYGGGQQSQYPDQGMGPAGNVFSPGDTQTQQPAYFTPGIVDPVAGGYAPAPSTEYGGPQAYSQGNPMGQIANQFSQMSMQQPPQHMGQKPVCVSLPCITGTI